MRNRDRAGGTALLRRSDPITTEVQRASKPSSSQELLAADGTYRRRSQADTRPVSMPRASAVQPMTRPAAPTHVRSSTLWETANGSLRPGRSSTGRGTGTSAGVDASPLPDRPYGGSSLVASEQRGA